jgi:hypothetical protein
MTRVASGRDVRPYPGGTTGMTIVVTSSAEVG